MRFGAYKIKLYAPYFFVENTQKTETKLLLFQKCFGQNCLNSFEKLCKMQEKAEENTGKIPCEG